MSQSLASLAVHIVFATKQRRPFLRSADLRNDLYAYMATVLRNNVDSPAIIIGGVEDHVHALVSLSRKFALMKVIEEAKTETSKWIKTQSTDLGLFSWQGGYGAFSVSSSNVAQVRRYIENQVNHHQKMTFQDEFRELCRRHGIALDERYAWD